MSWIPIAIAGWTGAIAVMLAFARAARSADAAATRSYVIRSATQTAEPAPEPARQRETVLA